MADNNDQEGVINLGLGTRADIGEWKSDVSGHRDVTFKPAGKVWKKVNKVIVEKSSRSNFSVTVKQII